MNATTNFTIDAATMEDIAAMLSDMEEFKKNVDNFFLISMAILVFLMQGGFALMEAGGVRSKSTSSILIKNFLDAFLAGVAYWIFGFAFAFGKGNSFIGWTHWASSDLPEEKFSFFFYQYVFASTASTIISGAMAERCEFIPFLIYNVVVVGFVYPVVTHWAWYPGGWLALGQTYEINNATTRVAFKDFSGSGVVHMCGGVAAFVGAVLLGPRIGRYDYGRKNPFRGHSVPLAAIGGFILVVGFLAFNGSSQLSITHKGSGTKMALAVVNTIICGSFSSVTSLFISRHLCCGLKKWSFVRTLNGAVAGMVASCAGCNVMYPWGSAVVGILAAFSFEWWVFVVEHLRVDDPLDIVAVHFGGGSLGLISVAFLDREQGILFKWDKRSGLFLGWQLVGLFSIVAWTASLAFIMFGLLKLFGILRVHEEVERKGLDIPKHGEPAYPTEAYGHGWIEKLLGALETGELPVENQGVELRDEGPYEHPEVKIMQKSEGRKMVHASHLVADEVIIEEDGEKKAYHTAFVIKDGLVLENGEQKQAYHMAYPITNEIVVDNPTEKGSFTAPYPVTDELPTVQAGVSRHSIVSQQSNNLVTKM